MIQDIWESLRRPETRHVESHGRDGAVCFEPDAGSWSSAGGAESSSFRPARIVDIHSGYFDAVPEARRRGEVLLLTESLRLVLEMRERLLDCEYSLTWTNNFWLAMSYMHERRFCGLVIDARVESVEERFLLQFMEEYDERSQGEKVLLAAPCLSESLRRQSRQRGHRLLGIQVSAPDVLRALGMLDSPGKDTWHLPAYGRPRSYVSHAGAPECFAVHKAP